jgi:hypothetical protein
MGVGQTSALGALLDEVNASTGSQFRITGWRGSSGRVITWNGIPDGYVVVAGTSALMRPGPLGWRRSGSADICASRSLIWTNELPR